MPLSLQEEIARCKTAEAWLRGAHARSATARSDARATAREPIVMRVSAHPTADSWVVPSVFEPAFKVLRGMSSHRLEVAASWGESAHPARGQARRPALDPPLDVPGPPLRGREGDRSASSPGLPDGKPGKYT